MAETATPKPGALASLRPEVGLPAGARRPFLLAAPVLIAAWALAGFYLSLGPTLAGLVVGSHSVVLGGLAVFALAGVRPLGALAAGLAASTFGIHTTLWIATVGGALSALWLVPSPLPYLKALPERAD